MARVEETLSDDILFPDDDRKSVDNESLYSHSSVYSTSSSLSLKNRPPQHNSNRDSVGYRRLTKSIISQGLGYQEGPAPHPRGPPPPYRPKPQLGDNHRWSRPVNKVPPNRKFSDGSNFAEDCDNYTIPNKHYIRRNTWSPCVEPKDMGVGSSFEAQKAQPLFSNVGTPQGSKLGTPCGSVVSSKEPIYADPVDIKEPANLPPESGKLQRSPNRVVLRPLAFKPVVPRKYTSPQSAYHEHGPSLDEGYSSNDCRFNDSLSTNGGGYGQIRKQMNSHNRRSSERSYSGEMGLVKAERPESHNSSNQSWISSVHGDYVQTPSPSDSGVGELEAIIRDKEAQINQIRDVMEKNERAIMQVYEDKQKEHEMDIKELQYEFEEKLKAAQQRALKMEQSLLMQNVKLQNENRELTDKLKQAQESLQISDRKCLDVERELDSCQNELEKHKWNLHQKCGELTHVKAQLKDAKDDLAVKMNESLSYKTRMKDLRDQLDEKQSDIHELDSKLHDLEEKMADRKLDLSNHNFSNCVTCCEKCNNETQTDCTSSQSELFSSRTDSPCDYGDEVLRLRSQMQRDRLDYEHDRTKWLDEKNKVICYQKQLQLNYVQMYRKNKMLEADIEQLTLDLERKDSQSLQEESVC